MVTGSTGSLGNQLVYEFLSQEIKPVCHMRESSDSKKIDSHNLQKRFADLRNSEEIEKAVIGIDAVIHTAAWVDFRSEKKTQFAGLNVMGALNFYKAASKAGVKRFVHVSTVGAVGANKTGKTRESCDENFEFNLEKTKIPYLLTKRYAELELLEESKKSKTELVIVNPSIIMTPKSSGIFNRRFIDKLFSLLIVPDIANSVNFVDVRDVAKGTILALEKGIPNERYILGGDNISLRELALQISIILGKAPHLIRIPLPLLKLVTKLYYSRRGKNRIKSGNFLKLLDYNWTYSSRKATENLGYRSRPIHLSLADILEDNFKDTL